MKTIVLSLLLGLGAGLWEVAIQPFLPSWLGLHPLLPISILFLVTSMRLSRPLVCALIGALLIDLFVVGSSDSALLRYTVILLLLDLLAHQFFTNRSLYATLGLMIFGRCLEWGSGWFIGSLGYWLGFSKEIWVSSTPIWYVIAWDIAFTIIGFMIIVSLTRRFSTSVRSTRISPLYER